MIPFPLGVLILLLALPVGWCYLALSTAPARSRRPLRALLIAALCLAPAATRGPGPVQLSLGLVVGYLAIRVVAVGATREQPASWGATARALISMPDLFVPARRRTRWLPAALVALLALGGCAGLLAAGAAVELWRTSRFLDDTLVLVEVALGGMGLGRVVVALAAARGLSVRGLQDRPAFSASLAEFWGRRWNRLVGGNLARGFFRPLSRRRAPILGLLSAFVASGVMHVIPVLASGPVARTAAPAAQVFAFFVLHALLVLGERALGWHKPPRTGPRLWAARARTVLVFVLLAPMMLDVYADITGVHGRPWAPAAAAQNLNETPPVP